MAWGSETRIRSCGEAVILVDESAEQVPAANIARADLDRLCGRCERWSEAEGAMRPPAVVVLGVGPEGSIEMPPPPDERPVEALGPHRLDHPFRVGVRVRSLDRGADHPYTLRAQDRVERAAELRVPVADEEPDRAAATIEHHGKVPRLLRHPRRVRVCGRGAHVDPPAAELDEHEDVQRPEPGGLDGEEVAGDDAIRLRPEELGPRWARAPRCRTEPGGPEQGADRRRSNPDPELAELALDPHAPRGDRKPGFDHAAAPWYSWMSPPSRSRRRTSRGLTGIGSDASARGWARPRARWGRPRL